MGAHNQKLIGVGRYVLLALAMVLLPSKAFPGAISVNGTCEIGNCAFPDILPINSTTSGYFSAIYTFPDTDSYRVIGSFSAQNTNGDSWSFSIGISMTYLGDATGSPSGADTAIIDWLQNNENVCVGCSGTFGEGTGGSFGGPIAANSIAQAQLFVDGSPLPVIGPSSPPGSWGGSFGNVPISGLTNPLLFEWTDTFTFGAGSGVGANITQGVVVTPEPSTLLLLGTALLGLALVGNRLRSF
jgi:hypothetical protein